LIYSGLSKSFLFSIPNLIRYKSGLALLNLGQFPRTMLTLSTATGSL